MLFDDDELVVKKKKKERRRVARLEWGKLFAISKLWFFEIQLARSFYRVSQPPRRPSTIRRFRPNSVYVGQFITAIFSARMKSKRGKKLNVPLSLLCHLDR